MANWYERYDAETQSVVTARFADFMGKLMQVLKDAKDEDVLNHYFNTLENTLEEMDEDN